jgi:hypothetical protein
VSALGAFGGGSVIAADTAALPQLSNQWMGMLVDAPLPAPPQLPVFTDPASLAVATAMNHWPAIHEVMTFERNAAAEALVAANNNTSAGLTNQDHGGAGTISNNPATTMLA